MQINYSRLEAKFHDTGSMIFLVGADKEREIEKLRGNAYDDVAIDEAQGFGSHLYKLVDDVLEASLMDKRGKLMMSGTPNAACAGMFHDACNQKIKGYSIHHWTVLQNIYMPKPAEWLSNLRKKRGWNEDHPTYMREYLGMWVRSLDSLVYKFNPERNLADEIPSGTIYYTLGVDIGTEDKFSIFVWAYGEKWKEAYGVEAFAQSGLTISEMAQLIKAYRSKYEPIAIRADTGGLGKAIVE
jgi:hypothetical protein